MISYAIYVKKDNCSSLQGLYYWGEGWHFDNDYCGHPHRGVGINTIHTLLRDRPHLHNCPNKCVYEIIELKNNISEIGRIKSNEK